MDRTNLSPAWAFQVPLLRIRGAGPNGKAAGHRPLQHGVLQQPHLLDLRECLGSCASYRRESLCVADTGVAHKKPWIQTHYPLLPVTGS